MERPSLKGSAIESLVEGVRSLVKDRQVTSDDLKRLTEDDLALLDTDINPAGWYPVDSYDRLIRLLHDVDGRGRPGYFEERGARVAERLFEAGMYAQLHAQDGAEGLTRLHVKLTSTIWDALLNFVSWNCRYDESDACLFHYELERAEDLPEPLRLQAQGFFEYAFSRVAGEAVQVSSTRDGGDVRYTIRTSSPVL